jgi:hypothetical protein
LLNQLLYWHDKGSDPAGWIYKSRTEILQETGLGRDSQETARRELRLRGFLLEKFGEMPRRLLFRLNLDAINDAWEEAIYQHKVEIHPTVDAACLLHKVEKHPALRVESTQQEGGKAPSKKGGFPPAYTESTTESTSEKEENLSDSLSTVTSQDTANPVEVNPAKRSKKVPESQLPGELHPTTTEAILSMSVEAFHCLAKPTKTNEKFWDTQIALIDDVKVVSFFTCLKRIDAYWSANPKKLAREEPGIRKQMGFAIRYELKEAQRNLKGNRVNG